MSYNIVFGTTRTGRNATYQKYEGSPVVTIEGVKEAGKSRRMLFNKAAMESLNLEEGTSQEIIFGFLDQDENGKKRLFIGNATGVDELSEQVTYTVSKNKIAYAETKEKGKGISSKRLMGEITHFLGTDESVDHEFKLAAFGEADSPTPLYDLVDMNDVVEEVAVEVADTTNEFEATPDVAEAVNEVEPVTYGSSNVTSTMVEEEDNF